VKENEKKLVIAMLAAFGAFTVWYWYRLDSEKAKSANPIPDGAPNYSAQIAAALVAPIPTSYYFGGASPVLNASSASVNIGDYQQYMPLFGMVGYNVSAY
jgi:hypothetical protein